MHSLEVLTYELSEDKLHFCDFLVLTLLASQNQMVTPPNKEGSVILHAVFYYVFF